MADEEINYHNPLAADKALECLLAGETIAATAQMCGVTPATISIWKRNPVFKAKLAEGRKQKLEEFRERIDELTEKAVSTLDLCLDGMVGETARWKATELVLRTHGLVGEKVQTPQNDEEKVEIIPLGNDDSGKIIQRGPPIEAPSGQKATPIHPQ